MLVSEGGRKERWMIAQWSTVEGSELKYRRVAVSQEEKQLRISAQIDIDQNTGNTTPPTALRKVLMEIIEFRIC